MRERFVAAADAAERRARQRPPAAWDPFPLTELMIFLGIVAIVVGAILGIDDQPGQAIAFAGVALASVGALENMIREHFAGFRSHAGMFAFGLGVVTMIATAMAGAGRPLSVALALAVAVGAWFPLRRAFLANAASRRR